MGVNAKKPDYYHLNRCHYHLAIPFVTLPLLMKCILKQGITWWLQSTLHKKGIVIRASHFLSDLQVKEHFTCMDSYTFNNAKLIKAIISLW